MPDIDNPMGLTPGEWGVDSNEYAHKIYALAEDGQKELLAEIEIYNALHPEQCAANFRMMAASPKLFQACLVVLIILEKELPCSEWQNCIDLITNATRLATDPNYIPPDDEDGIIFEMSEGHIAGVHH